jgi:hypothetical protein
VSIVLGKSHFLARALSRSQKPSIQLFEWVARMEEESVRVRLAEIGDYSICLPLFKLLYHGDIGPDFKNVFSRLYEGRSDSIS